MRHRAGEVAAIVGGGAGEGERLDVVRLEAQRALDQRLGLGVVDAALGRGDGVGVIGEEVGVVRHQLDGAAVRRKRVAEAAEDGVRARQHGPAFGVVGLLLHPLGELIDHRRDLLHRARAAGAGRDRCGHGRRAAAVEAGAGE
jgi:hypothetical protein